MNRVFIFGMALVLVALAFVDGTKQSHLPRTRTIAAVHKWVATENRKPSSTEDYLEKHRIELGLREYHQFRPTLFKTLSGSRITFAPVQEGVPILGMEIRLEVGLDGNVASLESRYLPLDKVDTATHLSESELLGFVPDYVADPSGLDATKVIMPVPGSNRGDLAYVVSLQEKKKGRNLQAVIRASDGLVLGKTYAREF